MKSKPTIMEVVRNLCLLTEYLPLSDSIERQTLGATHLLACTDPKDVASIKMVLSQGRLHAFMQRDPLPTEAWIIEACIRLL